MQIVLLNLDAGELDSETEELWSLFDVLHCACGEHAGDLATMERVAKYCANSPTVQLGAHPSYPDREHFGRRSMLMDPADLEATIRRQCGALSGVARGLEATVGHAVMVSFVKPHGALYHDAARDPAIADAVVRGVLGGIGMFVSLVGPPTSALFDACNREGVDYVREGFADRRMRPDGSLVPRAEPDALISDPMEAVRQAKSLTNVDTICVHADTPNAIEIARALREAYPR